MSMKHLRRFLWLCIWLGGTTTLLAQQTLWADLDKDQVSLPKEPHLQPKQYRVLSLDLDGMRTLLSQSGMEFILNSQKLQIQLPAPDGTWLRFEIVEAPIMPNPLAAKFPLIHTYKGWSVGKDASIIRLDITTQGFHAMVFGSDGLTIIEPANRFTTTEYISYYSSELPFPQHMLGNWCGTVDEVAEEVELNTAGTFSRMLGSHIKELRLALVADFRYTNYHGGTIGAMSAMNTIINQVNALMERDLAIKLTLIPNNDTLIIANSSDDPFSFPGNVDPLTLEENDAYIDQRIGSSNYDIGHVFTRRASGALGIATLRSICTSFKGRGCSGGQPPIGTSFYNTVAHELGHQLGSPHTFNSNTGGCFDNRSNVTAYEPGSGSTIMSYPGLCAPQNLQSSPNNYYHNATIELVFDVAHSRNCGDSIITGNQEPSVSAGMGGMFIPASTPFELTGTGSDPDGNSLLYCWEQFDLGPSGHPNSPVGSAPIFRSFLPSSSPSRTFPQISDLVNNVQTRGEILPSYQRSLTFRLTVRDNFGGVNWDEMSFNVWGTAGPFLVTTPNTSTTWIAETPQTVTWNVANTDAQPVNCQTVDILLSTDGGFTYPTVLATDIPNNGFATIQVPNTSSSTCRIRIQAHNNIFFDISNEDFEIDQPASPGFAVYVPQTTVGICEGGQNQLPMITTSLLGFNNPISFNFGGGLPQGVSLSVQPDPLIAGDTAMLVVNANASAIPGSYPVTFIANAPGTGGIPLDIVINISNELPEMLILHTPGNGASGTTYENSFSWQPDPVATSYQFQLATSPNFDTSTILEVNGLTDPGYILSTPLDTGLTYYWRARAENVCGPGPYFPVSGFQTGECLSDTSADIPQTIPLFGTIRDAFSDFPVSLPGTITDIRIVDLVGTHDALDEITVSLISPSATEVVLFSGICAEMGNSFDLNFDDGAWESTISCPPIEGEFYQPQGSLSGFIGQAAAGTWRLKISDNANFNGGELLSWRLEICTNSASLPELITNQTLSTTQWQLDTIPSLLLEASDAVSGPADLIFTLVELPEHGGLLLNGQNLVPGQSFTQEDINLNKLTYLNNGDPVMADHFRFDVQNTDGGWIGIFDFDINITLGPTSIGDLTDLLQVDVYPNPATSNLFIQLNGEWSGEVDLQMTTIQGQVIHRSDTRKSVGEMTEQISIGSWAKGVYLLEIRTEQGALWKKILVE